MRTVQAILLAAGAALSAAGAAGGADASEVNVILGRPGVQTVDVSNTGTNDTEWLTCNPGYAMMSAMETEFGRATAVGTHVVEELRAEAGYSITRSTADYWLGERVEAGFPYDAEETYDHWLESPELQSAFVMDRDGGVYAVAGGLQTFEWIDRGATAGSLVTNRQTYSVASASKDRPKRLFWTDPPFNSPAVDLRGKFARIFGSSDLVPGVTSVATGEVEGVTLVETQLVSGVVYDCEYGTLSVKGTPRGQFVLVYYDSGLYERILSAQVVEVCQPRVNPLTGEIGKPLSPKGEAWGAIGLKAVPTRPNDVDSLGDYFYQHKGMNSYSPKDGQVFPLRRTVGERWNMEVWWKEPDRMNVLWPYECDQYECDWPADAPVYVRGVLGNDIGAHVTVTSAYSVALMPFQQPLGHARLDDHDFYTLAPGCALLKLTANDDVWFMPVRSVAHDDRSWFTGAVRTWEVASEIRPWLDGLHFGCLATNRYGQGAVLVDKRVPGYVYGPATTGRYNLHIYPEAIFPVNAAQDGSTNETIEVWWRQSWRGFIETSSDARVSLLRAAATMLGGATAESIAATGVRTNDLSALLPYPVEIPSLVQTYAPVLPSALAVPEIVLASEKGSLDESVCLRNGAVRFKGPMANVELPYRDYFAGSSGGGTVMFWTRRGATADDIPEGGVTNAAALLTLRTTPDANGVHDRLSVASLPSNRIEVAVSTFTNLVRTVTNATGVIFSSTVSTTLVQRVEYVAPDGVMPCGPTNWLHVALAGGQGRFAVYLNGQLAGELEREHWANIDRTACSGWLGGSPLFPSIRAAEGCEVAEVQFWRRALGEDEIVRAALTTYKGNEEDLCGYFSVSQDGETDTTGNQLLLPDAVSGFPALVLNCDLVTPGPPSRMSGAFPDGVTPYVYYENDPESPGWNPNEEHALMRSDGGRYVVWALRCDLNRDDTSFPAVLTEWRQNGGWRMRAFKVVATNDDYPEFAGAGTVGRMVPGPHPFDIIWEKSWPKEIFWTLGHDEDGREKDDVPYRDRNGRLWFRAAGRTDVSMYYPMTEGFYLPSLGADQPAAGTAIPWLARLSDPEADVLGGNPTPWRWTASWPTNGVAEIKIGQTLTHNDGEQYPDIWNAASMAVVYPNPAGGAADTTVLLTDPTEPRKVQLSRAEIEACGFRAGQGGNVIQRGTKWFFHNLPPNVSDRVWYDTEAEELVFAGKEDADIGYLFLNVLTPAEASELKALSNAARWQEAIDAINRPALRPNAPRWRGDAARGLGKYDLDSGCGPRDHYALTGMGRSDWVVLVENDAGAEMVDETAAVKMHVLRTVPEYFTGRVKVREDPNNLIAQRLSIMSTLGFAGAGDDFVFEWRAREPNANGTVPKDYDNYLVKGEASGEGRTTVLVGGEASTMKDLVNTYWICRFKAKEGTDAWKAIEASGKDPKFHWSGWFEPPALAEGWLQRCLNNVTPFSQKMTDLYNNAAESTATMIAQAGGPYMGDVALNGDTLGECGLISLYRTLLNTAESLSLSLGPTCTDAAVNKQLLEAAERLHDLYVVLGDEAYADAVNPTIGFGSNFSAAGTGLGIDYGAASSSLFCFDNQVRTLLDEELCLLRGRDGATAPDTTEAPVYNRLLWNFTKGITAGEVAYAVNYDISGGKSTAIGAADAKAAFPQGHGDAYGHYLSALKTWYRLLRNPAFDWGTPSMGEMSVNGVTVNVDYREEAKFAEAAAKLARTTADVVDRTVRKARRDGGDAIGAGYADGGDNGFGYGEWAVRGGYGALCNWVVGNALLPETATNGLGEAETGLNRIDRGTVAELAEICSAAEDISRKLDTADAGLNPLGLSDDAIPFDIAPGGASDGTRTHYEQIRERAGTALANAQRTLDRAQEYSNRLRMIAETEDGYEDTLGEMEDDYNDQLIAVFGRPYSADVGASGTYASGYEGPDLYHYMWMDLEQYGLDEKDTVAVDMLELTPQGDKVFSESYARFVSDYFGGSAGTLTYELSESGIVVKPAKTAGAKRPANGEIQVAYGEFLAAYATAKAAVKRRAEAAESLLARLETYRHLKTGDYLVPFTGGLRMMQLSEHLQNLSRETQVEGATMSYVNSIVSIAQTLLLKVHEDDKKVGFLKWDPESKEAKVAGFAFALAGLGISSTHYGLQMGYINDSSCATIELNNLQAEMNQIDKTNAAATETYRLYLEVAAAIDETAARIEETETAFANMSAKAERLSEVVGRGNRLLEQRAAARQRAVSQIAKLRYNDMLFRQLRNRTLSQYASAFDLAQKYAFLAAKAFDYETGLLKTDARGTDFLAEIVAARSPGQLQDGVPIVAEQGDGGLASALAKMDLDWNLSLKGRLGINNPQPYATWFSLRQELFRIGADDAGRTAWKTALEKCRVADLRTVPEFARHCQPFQSSAAPAAAEPGLVIEFSSTIDFSKNFFGQELASCDSFFDSTYYCTKIANAGVWFEGYAQAKTPNVYLVPVGEDRMRAPGQDDGDYVGWNVVDQVIPVPYAIGGGGWTARDWDTWLPSYANGDPNDPDAAVKVRKHPSFRAYYGGEKPDDSMLDCPRLVGRSVWNSRWLLIIPAGSLGSDRDKALKDFADGVTDIQIGFKTYSNSGN